MELVAEYQTKKQLPFPSQQYQRILLKTPEGTAILYMSIIPLDFRKVPEDVIDAVGEHIQSVLVNTPVSVPDVDFPVSRPTWLPDENGSVPRASRGGGGGSISIPKNAVIGPDGEIVVPPRSDDAKHPDNKKFRRACRSARNAIRELAAKTGKSVELLTLEHMGEK